MASGASSSGFSGGAGTLPSTQPAGPNQSSTPPPNHSSLLPLLGQVQTQDPNSSEFRHTLESIFAHEQFSNYAAHLESQEDRKETLDFINTLDNALSLLKSESDSFFQECLRVQTKICGATGILPSAAYYTQGFTGEFHVTRPWRNGAFSEVHQATFNDKTVCLKRINTVSVKPENGDDFVKALVPEIIVWRTLSHPSIVQFLGFARFDSFQYVLVSEWVENESLLYYLESHPEANRIELMLHIVQGLQYLHNIGLFHQNLKARNVLIDKFGHAKLVDYGLIEFMINNRYITEGTVNNHRIETFRLQAPEMMSSKSRKQGTDKPTAATDVYAFAMCVYEMFSGKLPFEEYRAASLPTTTQTPEELRPKRPEGNSIELGLTDEVWSMIQRCWSTKPEDRPGVDDLIEFFSRSLQKDDVPLPSKLPADETPENTLPVSDEVELPSIAQSKPLLVFDEKGEASGARDRTADHKTHQRAGCCSSCVVQ